MQRQNGHHMTILYTTTLSRLFIMFLFFYQNKSIFWHYRQNDNCGKTWFKILVKYLYPFLFEHMILCTYNYTCIVCTVVHAFCTYSEIGNSQPCLLPPLRNFASLTWPPLSFSVVIMTSIQTQENTHTHQQWLNIHKDIKVRAQKHIQPVSWLPVRFMNLFNDTLH